MIDNAALEKYTQDLEKSMRLLMGGNLAWNEFWQLLNDIRLDIINNINDFIKSHTKSNEEYNEHYSHLYERYKRERPSAAKLGHLVNKIHSEAQFYESDDQARVDLNAQASEGMHYLDDDELRTLIEGLYNEAVQEGLWQDSRATAQN